jgi:FKBP-type peptidyl-prolyl cis-trans isomerase (trigger factor)
MSSRDKAAKFVELANKRVNKAIKDLKLIENLANRKNYEFTDEQVKKIIKALQKEIDSIKQSFMNTASEGREEFRL